MLQNPQDFQRVTRRKVTPTTLMRALTYANPNYSSKDTEVQDVLLGLEET